VSAPGRRWDNAAIATGACLGVGAALLMAGLFSHQPVLAGAGWLLVGAWAGSTAVVAAVWLNWHRAHGSEVCCVYRLRLHGRVRHLHWPMGKRGDCRHPVGFRANLRQRIE
jgi:hypothetical protein